ncbi:MAG: hypothetical protein RSB61_06200 [Clostridia bacterium]
MDYKAYYLKNHLENKDNKKKYVNNDYEHYRQGKELPDEQSPQIIYVQSPDGEKNFPRRDDNVIDYVPKNRADYNKENAKPTKKKRSVIRKIFIMILTIILSILMTFVLSDVITDGDLIASIFQMTADNKYDGDYYLVALSMADNMTDARLAASAMRLKGGGGFIYKKGESYYIIGDCFDDGVDAKAVVERNDGAVVVELKSQKLKGNIVDKQDAQALKGYLKYGVDIQEELGAIITQYLEKRIDKTMARDMVCQMSVRQEEIINSFGIKFAKYATKQEFVQIKSDMLMAKNMLDSICNDELSRPNFVCDLRYYKCAIVVNYVALLNAL